MLINISFDIEIPDGIDSRKIREWVEWNLRGGCLEASNPLTKQEFTNTWGSLTITPQPRSR